MNLSLELLLLNTTTNQYCANGANCPTKKGEISAYFPGNGGVLLAVGMMAGGWSGAPNREVPGFPEDWHVKAEGFHSYF